MSAIFMSAGGVGSWAGLLQAALIAIFATTTSFNPLVDEDGGALGVRYAMYQDVHVMMLVGFGFLYTLLRRYAWTGVSYNFLIAAAVAQWAFLTQGFWENVRGRVEGRITRIIDNGFAMTIGATARKRGMDDWKDLNPKGAGNTKRC
jgi:hypothetical protein